MRDTIELAREAGFQHDTKGIIWTEDRDGDCTEELKAFETLVRADEREVRSMRWDEYIAKAIEAEREACAKVCQETLPTHPDLGVICAAAIRARGNT